MNEVSKFDQERLFKLFFSQSLEMLCVASKDGYLLHLSPRWETVLGWSVQELKSKPFIEFVHPDDVVDTIEAADQLNAGQDVVAFSNRYITKDGSYRWLEWNATVGQSAELIVALVRDITDSMMHKLLLEESESMTKIGTWEINLATKELHWSKRTHEIHGTNPEAFKPKFDQGMAFYHPESIPPLSQAVQELINHGTPYSLDLKFITASGRNTRVRAAGRAHVVRGKVQRVFGTFQDIEEEHKLRESAEAHERELIERQRQLESFVRHAPTAIAMLDDKMSLVTASNRWLLDYGLTEKVIGKNHYEIFPNIPERWKRLHKRALKGESLQSSEDSFLDNTGRMMHIRWEIAPWYRADNSIGGIIMITENLTNLVDLRQKLESIAHHTPAAIYESTATEDRTMLSMSPYIATITGFPASDYLLNEVRSFSSLIDPLDQQRVTNEISAGLNQNGEFDIRYRIRNANGDNRWIWDRGRFAPNRQKLVGVLFDITDEVSAKSQVHELESAIDQSAIVSITDLNGVILHANQAFSDISQYSKEELIGRDHRIINSGIHPKEFFADMWNQVLAGATWRGEICNRKKDGTLYWVDSSIIPIRGLQGKIERLISIRYDVTKRKLSEQAMVHNAKMASLGEMAAGLAHEINNPLFVILARVTQLRRLLTSDTVDTENINRGLQAIEKTSDRIAKIVKGLKTFSRGGALEAPEEVSVETLVSDTMSLCEARFQNRNIAITTDIDKPLKLECRAVPISQVLLNLLNNAFDAIQNSSNPWIQLEVKSSKEESVLFRVTDSGAGIPTDVAEKIMMPFFTTKNVGDGTGLGLSIARGIIEDHHGKLWLDRDCANTRFCFEIPLKQPQMPAKK